MPGYKKYVRGQRNMVVEEAFGMGIRYTDTPMREGYCKNLINFDFKDEGQVLVPRAGYQQLHLAQLGTYDKNYTIHHTAQGILFNTVSEEDNAVRYILFDSQDTDNGWFNFADAIILVEQLFTTDFQDTVNKRFIRIPVRLNSEDVDTLIEGEILGIGDGLEDTFPLAYPDAGEDITVYLDEVEVSSEDYTLAEDAIVFDTPPGSEVEITVDYTGVVPTDEVFRIRRTLRTRTQLLHNMSLVDPQIFTGTKYLPVYAVLSGVAILPVEYTAPGEAAISGYARLRMRTDNTEYWAELEFLTPKEVSPTEAVNYGYNMLKSAPYSFADQISAAIPANYIIMEGILPYADEACTTLKFNAKVGEAITFKLFAQYPDDTSEYKFRWEIRELGTEDVTVYMDEQLTDQVYSYDNVSGDAGVKITIRPPFKQFSITVIAYSTEDLTEPLQAITLGSYHLAADTPGSTNNIEVRNYPLDSASDMVTWRQRLVLWGVRGAGNLIFISDINNPTYFPYPNSAHIFEEPVVACVPYLGDLLVFTENRLHRLKLGADGLTMTVDMIQDRLFMSTFDKETITIVQNMVFFKNGNYFFMVVPKKSSAEPGALQLAPISLPITNLLDNFYEEVYRGFDELYNPTNGGIFPPLTSSTVRDIIPHDYYNFLDNTAIRNVYKFRLVDRDRTTGLITRTLLYFDYILNYDTMARAWTSYILQTSDTRLWPYRQNVTDTTVFINTINKAVTVTEEDEFGEIINTYQARETSCGFVKPNINDPVDAFMLIDAPLVQSRLLRNFQYLDTGYRDHDTQYKKRYREIQFKVNNISQKALTFGTEFMIDDQMRKELYDYVTRHVTDASSEDAGYFYVEKIPHNPLATPGATVLADEDGEDVPYTDTDTVVTAGAVVLQSNCWVLDVSKLSKVAVAKIRFRVSGKGYAPRMVLLSYNDRPFELLSHNWVFRSMNAR